MVELEGCSQGEDQGGCSWRAMNQIHVGIVEEGSVKVVQRCRHPQDHG